MSPDMKPNKILIPFTIAMLALTVANVVNHLDADRASSPDRNVGGSTNTVPSQSSAGRSLLNESKSLIVTGVSSRIPIAEDYKLISAVPWDLKEISRLFRDAGAERSCELLDVGADVVQPLLDAIPNIAGPLGRRCAFSIRLQVGKELGEGLPSVTRGIIEDYLKSHQLTIQPTFYYNEQGKLILSPVIRAAFVRIDVPEQASPAESMIATSIRELRTLGTYWNDTATFTPADCRTLVLGFRYTLDVEGVAAKPNAQREFELVFLHLLPEATLQNPKLAVFATSDARTQFHLLEESNPATVEQLAAITADVRFADSKMMGMYPETPVVTKVRHRALLSIPAELVQSQIEGLAGKGPTGGFSGVLDELYARAMGTAISSAASLSETEPVNALEATPGPIEPTPNETADPGRR